MADTTILALVVTNAFTLCAATLGPWLQNRSRAEDRKRERDALLREKAEATFMEIGRIRTDQHARYLNITTLAANEGKGEVRPWSDELARLRGLVSVYFPSARRILEKHETTVTALRRSKSGSSSMKELVDDMKTISTMTLDAMEAVERHIAEIMPAHLPRP